MGHRRNAGWQAQAFGDRNPVGLPGNPQEQPVSRLEGLLVKFHAGVDRPLPVVAIDLEFGVVGGDDDLAADGADLIEDRHRQGRPFLRVGPGSQLVEQDQGVGRHRRQNLLDVRHVPRESRQVLFQGLFITDVGKDVVIDRHLRIFLGGDKQPSLGH